MVNRWLDRLERKFGRFAIQRLMSIILVGMVVIYCFDIIISFNPDATGTVSSLFSFNRARILEGQVWRIITFVFLPPETSILFAAFAFYFYWLLGAGLEARWGSFRFNVFYLIGVLGCIAVGFWLGASTNLFLNLSLFLAFAILYPNFEILLFFFIPVKIKWIGLVDAIGLVILFLIGGFGTKMLILASVLNVIIFFGEGFFSGIYYRIRKKYYQLKRSGKIRISERKNDSDNRR